MIRFLPKEETPKRNSRTTERFGDASERYIAAGRARASGAVREVNEGLGLPSGTWDEIDSGRSIVATRTHNGRTYYMNAPLVNEAEVCRWMEAAHRAGHAPSATFTTGTVVATSEAGNPFNAGAFLKVEEALQAVSVELRGTVRPVDAFLSDRVESATRRAAGGGTARQKELDELLAAVSEIRTSSLPSDFACHGDLVRTNIFLDGDRVVFIDPEPFSGNVCYDLSKLSYSLGVAVGSRSGEEHTLLRNIEAMERNSRSLYYHSLKQQAQSA